MPKTLFDKIWDAHQVRDDLLYIDLHLVHEVTSPQAFDGLRLSGRPVRRTDKTIATADHNVPTDGTKVARLIADELSRTQVETLERNCAEFGIPIYSLGSDRQGIVHAIGPELGLTQPGMTIVCGDSHTSTHGAFGALAFGIGTSEVEHVLATQTLGQRKPKTMRITYEGRLGRGVTAKDLILATIGRLGTSGAQGFVVEYAGPAIEALTMENRMTVCNMTIEGGGRAGLVAPDDTTFGYIEGRLAAPKDWDEAISRWQALPTDPGARFVEGRRVANTVRAMVVPGSQQVKAQAEREGLDKIFGAAGFEWRDAGCSMCLGMNPDILQPQERCASTSNRNFEGRQGAGGRTHLVSPQMAAAAAIEGHFVDIREWS